jgi:hypothetical protein
MSLSRIVVAALSSSIFAFATAGCVVGVDGEGSYEGHYFGTPETRTVPYENGKTIRIISRLGDVSVVRGRASDRVIVDFDPFIVGVDEEEARTQLETKLDLVASAGDEVLITASKNEGANSELGANVRIALPAGFDGALEIDQVRGDVDADLAGATPDEIDIVQHGLGNVTIARASGTMHVEVSTGDVDVDLASWSEQNGDIRISESGNIVFSVPDGANGSLTAVAGGGGAVTSPVPLPLEWQKLSCDVSTNDLRFGAGTGGTMALSTHTGTISIEAESD